MRKVLWALFVWIPTNVLVSWKWTPKIIYWPIAAWVVLEHTIPLWGATEWYLVALYHLGMGVFLTMGFDLWEELHQTPPSWQKSNTNAVVKTETTTTWSYVLFSRAWLPKVVLMPLAAVKVVEWVGPAFIGEGNTLLTWAGMGILMAMLVEWAVEANQQYVAHKQ